MSSKDESIKKARSLFNSANLEAVGQNFYRYTEPLTDEMISRKGLEREASSDCDVELTLITRHDLEVNTKLSPKLRVAVLQKTTDYEKEQERALSSRTRLLQAKYAK